MREAIQSEDVVEKRVASGLNTLAQATIDTGDNVTSFLADVGTNLEQEAMLRETKPRNPLQF